MSFFIKLQRLFFIAFITIGANAQNTNYTALYSSYNFVKTIDFSKPVGTVAGSAGSTASGGATYTIPIFTSPGTNGLNPPVSLVYNSQGGNGVCGFGWNISGLSAITRTGKNLYHNNTVKTVNYTNEDAFVLDGMHIDPITGNNGEDGTVYAGETETFAQIISYKSSTLNGPDWFKIILKDGTVMEYGNSTSSKFFTDTYSSVMIWRLNKMTDVNGNYIEYEYIENDRDSRISKIKYTGNLNTGLQPYNEIIFLYSIRADGNTSYDAGASISNKYLLDKIEIKHINDLAATETIKTYRLNYGINTTQSLLKEIVEFGGDEATASLNSTIFLYGDEPQSLTIEPTEILAGNNELYPGDFNADGKSDMMVAEKYYNQQLGMTVNTSYSLLSNMTQYSASVLYIHQLPQPTVVLNTYWGDMFSFLSGDFNGDTRDDVFLMGVNTGFSVNGGAFGVTSMKMHFTKSHNPNTGSTNYDVLNFPIPYAYNTVYNHGDDYNVVHPTGKNFFLPGDFDGDGNQDFILILGGHASPAGNNHTLFYKAFFNSPSRNIQNALIADFGVGTNSLPDNYAETIATADKLNVTDFDGDGKLEILVIKNQTAYIVKLESIFSNNNVAASVVYTTGILTKDKKIFPGDFNGDRKNDFLVKNTNGTWELIYSNGLQFLSESFAFNTPVVLNGNYSDDKVVVADFNGDGKSDIAHGFAVWLNGTSTSSKFDVYYGKGAGSPFYFQQYVYNSVLAFVDLVTCDINGDGRIDLLNRPFSGGNTDIISFKTNGQERILQKVTNGHNVTTEFTHRLMTDKSAYPYVYDRTISLDDPSNNNPFNYFQSSIHLLSKTSVPDGLSGNNETEYFYENAVLHRAAKGFLGFKKVTAKNNISGITSVSEAAINTQFATPYSTSQYSLFTNTGQFISKTETNISFEDLSAGGVKRFWQKTNSALSVDYITGRAESIQNTFDNYSNITNTTAQKGSYTGNVLTPFETATSSTTYGQFNTTVPAKPTESNVTNTRNGMPSVSQTSKIYYDGLGRVSSQIAFWGLPQAVTTATTYNVLGNPVVVSVSATGVNTRYANATYDAKGRFVLQTEKLATGLVSQKEVFTIDTKFGIVLTHKSTDNYFTTNEYDAFGKIIKTILPDGNEVTTTLNWHTSNFWQYNNPNKLYYVLTHSLGGSPDKKVYFDKYDREWKNETASMYGVNSAWHTQLTTYDSRGNVKTKSNLFFPFIPVAISNTNNTSSFDPPTETPRYTTYYYDELNRVSSVVNDIATVTNTYTSLANGQFKILTTNPAGQSSSKISDATGKVISATDNGGILNFVYDSRGNKTATSNNGITLVSAVFDIYGKQQSTTDVDAGTIQYVYDAFGQLTNQIDAKGNSYSMVYDDFGRLTTKTGPEGTTTYEYWQKVISGASNNNIKKITGFNGIMQQFGYGSFNRLQFKSQTIDGNTYTTNYEYTAYGQVNKTTYPSGTIVYNAYDASGYFIYTGLTPYGGLPKNRFFRNAVVDGQGRYLSYILGNGKTTTNTYDKDYPLTTSTPAVQNLSYTFQQNIGNLTQRSDVLKGQAENFGFDNLNRLTSTLPNSTQQLGITYDANSGNSMGNIIAKTDVGYYKYKNDKIHALAYTMGTPTPGQSPVTPAPVSVTPQTEQLITYTPFLKTASITEGLHQLNFVYGPNYERAKTELTQSGTIVETRYFFGDYEIQIKNGVTREIHYINGGNGLCAIVVKENGTWYSYVPYMDHLGSITTVTNMTGNIVAEQNFDAWGRRRNPNNWNTYLAPYDNGSLPDWLYRGYTGHEILPHFNLINMNGRMYDPILGRMLSPDNYVMPTGTQGYNRYSYANNNPLMYTDPDGNFIHLLVGAIIGAAVNVSVGLLNGRINSVGSFLKSAGMGALSGALSAAIGFGGFGMDAAGRAAAKGFIMSNATIFKGIASGIGSSFMPAIPFGDNFSISPSFAFGSHGLSSGLNATYSSGNFSLGFGFNNSKGNAGWSASAGWDNGRGGISYSYSHFAKSASYGAQNTGTIGFRAGAVSASWENDFFAGGRHDRWRTNGMGVNYRFGDGSSIGVGSRFVTGQEAGYEDGSMTYREMEGGNAPREGLFYFQFTSRNGISMSGGIDNERWMHGWQNGMHDVLRKLHLSNDRYFPELERPTQGFVRYGNFNSSTYFH